MTERRCDVVRLFDLLRNTFTGRRALEADLLREQDRILKQNSKLLAEHSFEWSGDVVSQDDEFEGWLRMSDQNRTSSAASVGDLGNMRQTMRRIVFGSGIAQGGLQSLADYAVGTGFTYTFQPPKGTPRDERANYADAIAQATAAFADFQREQRIAAIEAEFVTTAHRDGEAFLRMFSTKRGTALRMIDACDVDAPAQHVAMAPWGIEFENDDAQQPVAYYVSDGAKVGTRERVEADDIVHFKVGVDSNVARGSPPLWSVRNNLVRAERLVANMARLGEIQAAIAMVREHTIPVTGSSLSAALDAAADKFPTDAQSGKTQRQKMLREGSVVDVSSGTKLTFPTVGTSLTNYPPAIQAVLRPIAVRLGITEFMLTADTGSVNYAGTFVALAPVVKRLQRLQADLAALLWRIPQRFLADAIRVGIIRDKRAADLWVKIDGPEVSNRDELQQAQIREVEKRNGVLSVQTWSAESGRDYEEEQINRAEHSLLNGGADDSPLPDPTAGGPGADAAGAPRDPSGAEQANPASNVGEG